ncbi:DUF2066 domain-containing protein [Thaumasiovibrio sp. DFM-14]|uniref:DUF2066 domain-containing protein n=1 Tax=Thaumasiovibrio sp. DFM-14 TaxID=3384792 RepID=UPI0039A13B72
MYKVLIFILAVFTSVAQATPVTGLYRAQIPLADTDRSSEQKARTEAFEQVILKLTGNEAAFNNDVLDKARNNAGQYVRQLSYENIKGETRLNVTFDPAQIQSVLTQAQINYWPTERPMVLVWVVEEQAGRRNILWDQSNHDAVTQLKQRANERALPLLVPVGDFDDQISISVPDLWGGFAKPIGVASTRYQPDAVLVIRDRVRSGKSSIDWQLYPIEPTQMQTSRPEMHRGMASGDDAYRSVVDEVASFFAERMARPLGAEGEEGQQIAVTNVQRFEDLLQIERSLMALTNVASVRFKHFVGNKAQFGLNLLGSEEAFKREWLALPQVSIATSASVDEEQAFDETVALLPRYRWN